jgi:thiosulfate dehydrogenase
MRNFVLGIVVTIIVLVLAGLGVALLGFAPTKANTTPPEWERRIAMGALDSSIERHAARLNNPIPPTDENLIAGLKTYTMICAECHGGIDRKPSEFGHSFYPPAPSLILDPPDDPEWQLFYVVRNGIRNTGMPAFDKGVSEADTWKITAFLSRIEKLPPAVQEYWKKSGGAEATAESHDSGHHD